MAKHTLWNWVNQLKGPEYTWVELSHEVSPQTPHWSGYSPLKQETALEFNQGDYNVLAHKYELVGQYGTHVDAPYHFVKTGKRLHEMEAKSMILPLCVINVSEKVAANPDYAVQPEDILAWEDKNGTLPSNSLVAMRTDWSKRPANDFDNADAEGKPHYPGWSLAALTLLVQERKVAAIGHETPDTDSPAAGNGWIGELYVLKNSLYQIELMQNLDLLPETGAVLFAFWPKVKDATGFSARCVAVFEN